MGWVYDVTDGSRRRPRGYIGTYTSRDEARAARARLCRSGGYITRRSDAAYSDPPRGWDGSEIRPSMRLRTLIETTPRTSAVATLIDTAPPAWRVTLRRAGRRLTVPWYQGPAVCSEPTAEDVLACLLSDATSADESWESWCSEYGYDPDSRRDYATYQQVRRQTRKLRRFLGEEDFESFLYAED